MNPARTYAANPKGGVAPTWREPTHGDPDGEYLTASVTKAGTCDLDEWELRPEDALALGQWLVATFGAVPA